MKKVVKQTLLSITAITVIVIAIWYMLNIFEYSLRATTKSDGSVIIQSLSLGEYYTPVTLFEVYESTTSLKVVALERKSEDSRVHTITLRQGLNHFDDYVFGWLYNQL